MGEVAERHRQGPKNWEQVCAAAIREGDITPAGKVHHVHRFPCLRLVELGIGEHIYVRNYYAHVTRRCR